MKNTSLILLLLVLVLGAVGAYALMNKNPETSMVKTDQPVVQQNQQQPSVADDAMKQESGVYTAFTPEVLASSANTRRVLFFFANWCPTCKPVDERLSENQSQLPKDLIVIRVSYNDTDTDQAEKDLAKQYGITYQHTFVQIDAQGNELAKWNGGGIDELLNNIK